MNVSHFMWLLGGVVIGGTGWAMFCCILSFSLVSRCVGILLLSDPSWQKSGPRIHNHSWRAILIIALSWIHDLPCCFRGPNYTTGYFVTSVKWCICLSTCQQPISIVKKYLNLWQEEANESACVIWWKIMTVRWNKWRTFEVMMNCHWFSGLTKP